MKVNDKTFNHIKASEGLSLIAYKDPGSKDGLPITIGYGTTRINGKPFNLGLTITKEQADRYFRKDIDSFASEVAKLVKVSLTENQFGALVSLAYNIGIGAFSKSTLLRILNAGDYAGVPAQFRRWNKNDGKVMKGLVNRRESEIKLWLEPSEKVTDGNKGSSPSKGSSDKPTGLLELLISFLFKLFGKK